MSCPQCGYAYAHDHTEAQDQQERIATLEAQLAGVTAVGKEMAEQFTRCMDVGDKHFKTYATGPGRALVSKWRRLEGESK